MGRCFGNKFCNIIQEDTIDQLLLPVPCPAVHANFEHILLPYGPVADFTGRNWPRSMAKPAILSAVKLFMGLEERRDAMNRQINDGMKCFPKRPRTQRKPGSCGRVISEYCRDPGNWRKRLWRR